MDDDDFGESSGAAPHVIRRLAVYSLLYLYLKRTQKSWVKLWFGCGAPVISGRVSPVYIRWPL